MLGAEVLYHDTGWNTVDGTIIPYVNGWFLACMRDVFMEMKGFDWITFSPHDFEDIDLSLRFHLEKMKLTQLDCASGLRHMGARTAPYGNERTEITKANQRKFREKWSGRLE